MDLLPNDKRVAVRLSDLMVLINAVRKGVRNSQVGYEDYQRTYLDLTYTLERTVHCPIWGIESALWAAKLLDERGEFEDHRDNSFEKFTRRLAPRGYVFNNEGCFFEKVTN